jgi:hypothetical protein
MQLMKFPLLATILFAGAGAMATGTSVVISMMIDKVNNKLSEDKHISRVWGYPGKVIEVKDQYKRFYPEGSLPRVLNLLTASMIVMFAVSFVLLLQFFDYL